MKPSMSSIDEKRCARAALGLATDEMGRKVAQPGRTRGGVLRCGDQAPRNGGAHAGTAQKHVVAGRTQQGEYLGGADAAGHGRRALRYAIHAKRYTHEDKHACTQQV
jgi:hypothetical protein